MPRIQSPSSVNLFKQCPRKYYYRYILNLESVPSIHTIRGNITHSVLQYFFDVDISALNMKNFQEPLKHHLQALLMKYWNESKAELNLLCLSYDQLIFYFEETMMMLFNWFEK